MAQVVSFNHHRRKKAAAFFTRAEINQLMALYAEKQLKGEWRHGSFDQRLGLIAYSVFESPIERPIYRIIKCNHADRDKGRYVLYKGRKRVSQAHDLKTLLGIFGEQAAKQFNS
jgi:hypothetical protein